MMIPLITFGGLTTVAEIVFGIAWLILRKEDMPLTLAGHRPVTRLYSPWEEAQLQEFLYVRQRETRDMTWLDYSLRATGPVQRIIIPSQTSQTSATRERHAA